MADNNIVMKQLAALQRMELEELREKFAELYGTETTSYNLQQLRKRLAYRIQEIYYGGLTTSEFAILGSIAAKDPVARMEKNKPTSIETIRGTRFSREWHGKVYEVIVTGDGTFEYEGRIFKSLSAIAKEITGTQWNGKLFFGVTEKARKN